MPEDMDTIDIHRGTDVEFGQSIYEPFGIAPFEPLTFGGALRFQQRLRLRGFVSDASGMDDVRNVIVADYTAMDGTTPTMGTIYSAETFATR